MSVDDKICRKIVKDFKSQYRSNLIKISVKRNIEDGIFLKEKSNSLLIINNICSEEVEIEKKKNQNFFNKSQSSKFTLQLCSQ